MPKDPGILAKIVDRLGLSLNISKANLFFFSAKKIPCFKAARPHEIDDRKQKRSLVTELLDRNLDFTVEEINSKKMADQKGAFFLGWDRNNPQFDKERNFVAGCHKKR